MPTATLERPEPLVCPTCKYPNTVQWRPGQLSYRCLRCHTIIAQRSQAEADADA